MRRLLLLGLVGLAAQLVDGTLGMAYGVTTTTLLLATGYAAVVASAAVHLAETGTTLASGLAHWRLGNVDWRLVLRLGVPGAVGGFLGATALAWLSTESSKPWTSGVLLALGIYILIRFSLKPWQAREGGALRGRFLVPLGFVGGFIDATGGGGWGPVTTPALLSTGRVTPRTTIGSVDTSELLVALAASAGFLLSMDRSTIPYDAILPLLIGGLIAAPLAAWLVRLMPTPILGVLVGWIVIQTNTRTILKAFGVDDSTRMLAYAVIAAVSLVAFATAVARWRREGGAGDDAEGESGLVALAEGSAAA